MLKNIKYLTILLVLILVIESRAEESLTGNITGIVIDGETKNQLSGATIRVLNSNFGAVANIKGEFFIKDVPIGRYQLLVSLLGYEQLVIQDVIVVTKRNTNLTLEMTMSYIDMQEVIVSAETLDNTIEYRKISQIEIKNQEIRNTAGVNDLFRRLTYMSGINVSGEQSSAPIVRGGNPDENLYLIENIEVYSPFHFSSLNSEAAGSFSIIDPKLIEQVNISTGGFNAQYGDKLSSVIQIDLKKPDKNRYEGDISLDFSGLGAYLSGPITENSSFFVAARRGILEYLMKAMEIDFIPTTTDIHFKYNYEPSQKHRISLYGLYAQDKIEGSHADNINADKTIFSLINKSQTTLGINWRWLTSNNSYLLTTPYINFSKWELSHGPENAKNYYGELNDENYSGIKTEYFIRLANLHRVTIGGEFRVNTPEYSKWAGLDTTIEGTIIQPFRINYKPNSSSKYSTYIQYAISPYKWLNINSGVRGDYFSFINQFIISPRISMNFNIVNELYLNIATGKYTQFPEYYRIFLAPENKDLKPQQAIHYITGIETPLFYGINAKIEGFYKDYSFLAVAENDTSKILQSTGEGYAYGIETNFSKRIAGNMYMLLNYSYLISKRRDESVQPLYFSNYDITHRLNLILNYQFNTWWELSITTAYGTGMPYTPLDLSTLRNENGVWYVDKGEKNSVRYPDYFRIDARIDRRFVFKNWNLRTYFEIWNVTNHKNIFEYGYENNYTKKTSEVLFPFMPIIGISAEL